jgi:hypothetical protein
MINFSFVAVKLWVPSVSWSKTPSKDVICWAWWGIPACNPSYWGGRQKDSYSRPGWAKAINQSINQSIKETKN